MSYEADEEILQDFLIEAGEIIDALSEQLVELENDPDNADLLNAIFRGFHTVKGGAGFLALTDLVDICHGAENVFDILRNNQRSVTAELMDVILQSHDTINEMFVLVQNREQTVPAEPALLAELHRLSIPEAEEVVAPVIDEQVIEVAQSNTSSDSDEMSDDEFEKLLDELHGSSSPSAPPVTPTPATSPVVDSNEITDDDFEALLDEIHGQGAFSSKVEAEVKPVASQPTDNNDITDDDFEALLDELHGKGQAPKVDNLQKSQAVTPKAEIKKAVAPVKKAIPVKANPVAKPATSKSPAKPTAVKDKKPSQPAANQGETTVRVDTQRLDKIMNMVGELVLVRNRLTSLGLAKEDEELTKVVSN
jgi:two-component system chemotaxis sensor kinase CheA